jgi:hypothetical protein
MSEHKRGGGLEPWQRPPFEAGNTASVRHGSYAVVKLGPRVDELADELRELVPGFRPADEVALRLLGVCLARIEAASTALEEAGPVELERLRQDLRGWLNTARRLLNDLGMTPTARARLGLDVARMTQAVTVTSLAEEAELERREGKR